jgi:4-hydroxymandelate oxidase
MRLLAPASRRGANLMSNWTTQAPPPDPEVTNPDQIITVDDYAPIARRLLTPEAWDYYDGGGGDEITLRANCEAYRRIKLRPRVLVDIANCDLSTVVSGSRVSMPILIAPMAYHGLAHSEAEMASVEGARLAQTLMVSSINASRTLEQIAAYRHGPLWQQLYFGPDRAATLNLVGRIERAGYQAIVLTVDRPVVGMRKRDLRNRFKLPTGVRAANFGDAARSLDAICAATWEDLSWLINSTTLPVMVKGILTGEDASRAAEMGAAAIMVSNHGGRQLDSVNASIDSLKEVVLAVGGRCDVYCDGGIRRGTDVLKALAIGAKAVLVGRPILWGLAAEGAQGVARVLEILRQELRQAMMLAGRPTINDIDSSLIGGF